jgi:hypothetical protein
MPRIRIVETGEPAATEDSEGHMPRIKIVESGEPAKETDDTEGQAIRSGRAPAIDQDEAETDDTEGNKKNFRS